MDVAEKEEGEDAGPKMTEEEALALLVSVDREPSVITNQLILDAVNERRQKLQGKKKEKDDSQIVNFDDITELSLEYYNILKIDHLWVCKNLTILSLSNNIIEKIENFDELINLVELNLSFNRISKIKNLTKLENLERLSLYNNKIVKLKNLSALRKLQVLSLGQNMITDARFVVIKILALFKNLRSLNLEGNPCETEVKNFRLAVAGFIPQLVYYNYFILRKEERAIARQKYQTILRTLERAEEEKEAAAEEEKKKVDRANYLKRACIENFERSNFYDYLMENDNEGKTLFKISERVKEVFYKFKEALNAISKRLFSIGEKQYAKRIEELTRYGNYYKESMVESLAESRALIRDFTIQKSSYIQKIKEIYSNSKGEEPFVRNCMKQILIIDKDFAFLRRKTWWFLMEKEMKRYEKNESSMSIFETNMTEMVNKFIDFVQEEFTRMRDTESEFCDGLSDQINRYIAEFQSKGESPVSIPFFLRSILLNKETLNNFISTSHDNHLLLIDNKEEEILEKLRTWLRILLSDLTQYEIDRNRKAVLEIHDFMDHNTLDWSNQVKSYVKDALTYMTKVEPKWTNEIMRLKMSKKERLLDDKMQMLLRQKTEFDRKDRIRRDKIRRSKKQEQEQVFGISDAESTGTDQISFDKRKLALDTYEKVFEGMDRIVNNLSYLDFENDVYSEKFDRSSYSVVSAPRIKRSISYFTSGACEPLPKEETKEPLTDEQIFDHIVKITQSFKAKYTPVSMFRVEKY